MSPLIVDTDRSGRLWYLSRILVRLGALSAGGYIIQRAAETQVRLASLEILWLWSYRSTSENPCTHCPSQCPPISHTRNLLWTLYPERPHCYSSGSVHVLRTRCPGYHFPAGSIHTGFRFRVNHCHIHRNVYKWRANPSTLDHLPEEMRIRFVLHHLISIRRAQSI